MAKKKPQNPNMEENQADKLASLKSLNNILLKETVEKRDHVKNLELEIDVLKKQLIESEIQKSVTVEFVNQEMMQENQVLKRDFVRFREEVDKESEVKTSEVMRLEKRVEEMMGEKVEVEIRFEDLRNEMEGVLKQRGELEREVVEGGYKVRELEEEVERGRVALDGEIREKFEVVERLNVLAKEMKGLKSRVFELVECNAINEEEIVQLRSECGGLMGKKKELEKKVECVVKEKVLVEHQLDKALEIIDELDRDSKDIAREKEIIEENRGVLVVEMRELKKQVQQFEAIVFNLKNHEGLLRREVVVFKERNDEAVKKQEQMQLEFGKLLDEKSEIEMSFELLIEEKNSTLRNLEKTRLELENGKRRINELVYENDDIQEVKIGQELEIQKLLKQLSGLKAVVSKLEESCGNQVKANAELQSEAGGYKDALESVTAERDSVRKEFDMWKNEEESLSLELLELEKSNGENLKELERLRVEQCKLSEEKKEMKSRIDLLIEDKGELQRKLVKAEGSIEDVKAKLKSHEMYIEQALLMLKSTVEMLENGDKEDSTFNAEKIDESVKPFAEQLEAIKRAFENKKGKVEDMKREFQCLNLSMAGEKKSKKFLQWLSSGTTILAVAAVAMSYVGKGR
ncbi:hypothetical protein IFM89_015885 [Coptis chinensis]|uniref:Uncharacterized protein n=1 Tax=Coptis chinensis TaxID=261450 RepID=A0A835HV39_9MAGN|nr:hypothetical protein IFM89_015885 [Coptis chinensis]